MQWTIVEAVIARRHGAARGGVCVLIDGAMFVCSDRKKDVTAARLSLAFPVRFNPAIVRTEAIVLGVSVIHPTPTSSVILILIPDWYWYWYWKRTRLKTQ